MLFLLALLVVMLASANALLQGTATTCDSYNTDEKKCLTAQENGVNCAYCTSGAVGAECLTETDAQGLPTSVFRCTYQAAKAVKASGCESQKDKTSCLKATEAGEKCAYCTSAAVGASCNKESDAKALPSSVFKCEYA